MPSGPSLGRKRPRRAAIARGATAPQQYATALHKTQGLLNDFPCKTRGACTPATHWLRHKFQNYLNTLDRCSILRSVYSQAALDFVMDTPTKNARLLVPGRACKM